MRPFVSSMFYVPRKMLSPRERKNLKEELTLEIDKGAAAPTSNYADEDDMSGDGIEIVKCYDVSVKGYFGVPRYFGTQRFAGLQYDDRTAKGEDVTDNWRGIKPIKPRDEQQRAYFQEIANICNHRGDFIDYVAVAKTGSGKTASLINGAIKSRRPHLVLVHKNRLKEQWLGSIERKNGLRFFCGKEFVEDFAGIVQQNICDFENKAIVIGLIQSVSRRQYPDAFYRYFAGVHFDELHKHMAPAFAKAIMKFPQAIRGGMTATMREDALKKVSDWHFGPVRVTSEQEVLKADVYICRYKARLPKNAINTYSKASILTSLTELEERNHIIAKIAYNRGVKRNRQFMIISDRVQQLQKLRKLLIAMGTKKNTIGLYTGRVYTGKWKAVVSRSGFRHKVLNDDGKEFFPSKHKARAAAQRFAKANNLSGVEIKVEEDYYTLSPESYELMEKKCSIFLVTYGIFAEGNDISRLDMGIEASPRADIRQPLGRIVRLGDKNTPEWYSITDDIVLVGKGDFDQDEPLTDLLKQSVARKKRFKQSNTRIINVRDVRKKFR